MQKEKSKRLILFGKNQVDPNPVFSDRSLPDTVFSRRTDLDLGKTQPDPKLWLRVRLERTSPIFQRAEEFHKRKKSLVRVTKLKEWKQSQKNGAKRKKSNQLNYGKKHCITGKRVFTIDKVVVQRLDQSLTLIKKQVLISLKSHANDYILKVIWLFKKTIIKTFILFYILILDTCHSVMMIILPTYFNCIFYGIFMLQKSVGLSIGSGQVINQKACQADQGLYRLS